MRRFCIVLVLIVFAGGIVTAQEEPQIAYRLLDEYIREKQAEGRDKTGAVIAMIAGGVLFTTGGILMIAGDDISRALSKSNETWDPTTKWLVSGTLAGTGLVSFGIGTGLLLSEPPDMREQYSSVYEESDPETREALAAAALKDLSDNAYSARVTRGIIGVTTPFLSVGITILANVIAGPPRKWYDDLLIVSSWQIWNLTSGITALAVPTEEERLYQRYLTAKEVWKDSENR